MFTSVPKRALPVTTWSCAATLAPCEISRSARVPVTLRLRDYVIHGGDNCANHRAADHLEYLYDLCLVWPSQIPQRGSVEGHPRKLGHRLFRVLLPGTGKSHRLVRTYDRSVEDHSGSNHAFGVFCFFCFVSRREAEMELRGGVWLHCSCRLLCVSQVVTAESHNSLRRPGHHVLPAGEV